MELPHTTLGKVGLFFLNPLRGSGDKKDSDSLVVFRRDATSGALVQEGPGE